MGLTKCQTWSSGGHHHHHPPPPAVDTAVRESHVAFLRGARGSEPRRAPGDSGLPVNLAREGRSSRRPSCPLKAGFPGTAVKRRGPTDLRLSLASAADLGPQVAGEGRGWVGVMVALESPCMRRLAEHLLPHQGLWGHQESSPLSPHTLEAQGLRGDREHN